MNCMLYPKVTIHVILIIVACTFTARFIDVATISYTVHLLSKINVYKIYVFIFVSICSLIYSGIKY